MKYIAFLTFIILSTSCKKASHQNNEITKVELARAVHGLIWGGNYY
ncbi:MAG: hypothetical protein JWP44_2912 [Mucilaginibacter sp.]|nr:hypothetical protein [Mucilaginibacter sp.]